MESQAQQQSEIIEQLVGAWTLVAWYETTADGEVRYPLGENAIGQIIYTADRRVAAQLVASSQARLHSEDWREATEAESARAWKNYFGYFGAFSIDLDRQAVVHHIEGSWFPNLQGTDQVRRFRFEGKQLVLDADTGWGKVHIVWRRAGAGT
jgi:hypothetical protein